MRYRIHSYGRRALLVELGSLDAVLGLHRALSANLRAGVVELVPAAATITVCLDPAVLSLAEGADWVRSLDLTEGAPMMPSTHGESVDIEVAYSGSDLAEVARLAGMSEQDVVRCHTESKWQVAFTGFAPGFGYLVTDHTRLQVPRRAQARASVAAGSVGLADVFSGIYPRASPGGWQIIGHTETVLWNAGDDEPALLRPGASVQFREVR